MVWSGETMRRVMAQIERVAASESRVCIYGETGTGKELVARTLHEKSHRATGPFVTLNCAAVPADLSRASCLAMKRILHGRGATAQRQIRAGTSGNPVSR